ncbi:MAG TPA: hypothetical protein VHY35_12580 [Stellaceae bacterium]|jgi:hypothetical protein|nr:hypothetical protein [Stellaceae bacterium]
MSQIIVGRWGRNLAIRIPGEIAEAAGSWQTDMSPPRLAGV